MLTKITFSIIGEIDDFDPIDVIDTWNDACVISFDLASIFFPACLVHFPRLLLDRAFKYTNLKQPERSSSVKIPTDQLAFYG
ncbi:hypothetical protein E0H39_34405 [Rhizobium leguminosarum bv. viciae]|uniref:Uncharacterized protein n=1 Tax=Rhizobium leguminosarum bv. viciae TaxID=387 RepID=A0A7G6RMB4_RHILV|nr:hypothetical protein [Rhizobium leguminosarum]ASS59231.1 hypothetical protein CHR56_32045 [Rhizobium leguminosarum bv. viciae]MBB4390379.1 hypothetical protein [Rhizobium leguminosarum]MBB4469760.1 hypothetical protein [Rhizobium leguminosarum]MBB6298920.1 hypothetical protein [Rhizobium leguminosarum]MBY5475127.1 hypothetical protein [Rhizobium leguminosarum]